MLGNHRLSRMAIEVLGAFDADTLALLSPLISILFALSVKSLLVLAAELLSRPQTWQLAY